MLYKANAKINLSLDVERKRPDGYHDVRMIMQSVNICDYLDITKNDEKRIIITCDNAEVPCNESNLVYRAASKLMEHMGQSHGITIKLAKNIPIAAGMAGGSADAAATLVGVNEVLDFNLKEYELRKIGATLGADIPFCIMGGTCISEGIGDILTPIDTAPPCFLVIAKPDINVSTKFVYDNLKLGTDAVHPNVDNMISAIANGDLQEVSNNLGNILETVTIPAYPVIEDIKSLLLQEGALGSLMSGSGPTVFGIFTDEDSAHSAKEMLNSKIRLKQSFVTTLASKGIEKVFKV